MAKEWFSHDYGTRNKRKLAAMIHEEGSKGYGLFWIIVEMLYEDRNKFMEIEEYTYLAIKKESGDDIDYIRDFIKKGIEVYKVFKVVKKKFFTTERVIENEKTREVFKQKKSEAGRKSAQARAAKSTGVEHVLADVEHNLTKSNTGYDMIGYDITGKDKERESPPVLFTIEHCLTVAMNDPRWVKANKVIQADLLEFNAMLEKRGVYEKNPMDYKTHFANWKLTGKKDSEPDKDQSHKTKMVV